MAWRYLLGMHGQVGIPNLSHSSINFTPPSEQRKLKQQGMINTLLSWHIYTKERTTAGFNTEDTLEKKQQTATLLGCFTLE